MPLPKNVAEREEEWQRNKAAVISALEQANKDGDRERALEIKRGSMGLLYGLSPAEFHKYMMGERLT